MLGGFGTGAAGAAGDRESEEEETTRVRQDIKFLREQKEALVVILQDLYGPSGRGNAIAAEVLASVDDRTNSAGQVAASSPSATALATVEQPAQPQLQLLSVPQSNGGRH